MDDVKRKMWTVNWPSDLSIWKPLMALTRAVQWIYGHRIPDWSEPKRMGVDKLKTGWLGNYFEAFAVNGSRGTGCSLERKIGQERYLSKRKKRNMVVCWMGISSRGRKCHSKKSPLLEWCHWVRKRGWELVRKRNTGLRKKYAGFI